MIQWGMHKFTPLTENKVDLPIPFKNAILNIQIIDTGYAAIPMSGIGNGTLNSFRAWVSGRFFTYSGGEVQLTPEMNINGQYLVIGY
ncbi:hypothetical protein ID850_07245 [Xenorhabdus sp. Flor]|uniref:gp53-like domain-containing protein n=1 Tax=Xenorhabdus cabanillasii TaxID=351673 RepID=UPI001993B131|nr:hypothetical protein [Xenorhabdus sp. Flor]MBD2814562.1 hypothetical protein [Xenorhabdus sp. Flor]